MEPLNLSLYPEFNEVEYINYKAFYVFIKWVSSEEFSQDNLKKNLKDMNWVDVNVRDHDRVISSLLKQSTVVPFNFGTVYRSEDSLKKFIDDYSGPLLDNFHYVENKEEWSIKIYSNPRALTDNIDSLSTEAAKMEKKIKACSSGKAYILKRKKEEFIKNEISRLNKMYGQAYYDKLKNVSEASNLNNIIPQKATKREDEMILNTNFLVKKDRKNDFKQTINRLKEEGEQIGFIIEETGPWPPYSFISLKGKNDG
ncbi:MAG: GvpL/GvpF family gas vesicle protein [Bacteroidales bacterium]|nr:GvpL/GvpF family gas vesicle protein [Bacteroidales bacterium]MCF8338284.1 GvpL/GvpF family gas vesicle protein [Bacteroidales bacterium]